MEKVKLQEINSEDKESTADISNNLRAGRCMHIAASSEHLQLHLEVAMILQFFVALAT